MSGRIVGVRLGWDAPLGFYEVDEDDLRPGETVVIELEGAPRSGTVVVAAAQWLGSEVEMHALGRARRPRPEERLALASSPHAEGERLLRSLPDLAGSGE